MNREEEKVAWRRVRARRGMMGSIQKQEEEIEEQKGEGREGVRRDEGTGDQSWCVFQSDSSLILWKGVAV